MRRWINALVYLVLALSTLGGAVLVALGNEWGGSAVFLALALLLGRASWKAWRAPRAAPAPEPLKPPGVVPPIAWGAALFAFDVFVGGAMALLSIFTVLFLTTFGLGWALVTWRNRAVMLGRLRAIAITSAMAATAIAWGVYDGAQAEHRVLATAAAVKAFAARHGRYPDRLEALVPAFLPEAPYAHRFGMARRLYYKSDGDKGPWLMYVSTPPFGRRSLEVETGNWQFVD